MAPTNGSGPPPRRLTSWIDAYSEYTSGTQSPAIFRRWTAVAIIAGALERKVWLRAFNRTLYPNLYVLLVGGPGIGKTDSLREAIDFWGDLPEMYVAPSSVSKASLIDALNDAKRSVFRPADVKPLTTFNSLSVASTEFGVFLTAYEQAFMSTLNDLYDCVKFDEKKRSLKEAISIPSPQLNIIAATTPAWLGGTLPQTAWSEGFSSRLLMVSSGEKVKIDPFMISTRDLQLHEELTEDLKGIHSLYGQFLFEEEVVNAFRNWYMEDCPPIPEHPKLAHYLPRRHIHFLKLCMAMSASRSNDLHIRLGDYQRAMDLLLEAEASMPDVFKAMMTGGDSLVIDETYRFVWEIFAKEKRAVQEHRIMYFIGQRVPSFGCKAILDQMVASNILQVMEVGEKGRNAYRPAPRASH